MQEYLSQVRRIQTKFKSFDLSHIPRSGNTHADSLATLVTSSAQNLPRVIIVKDLCTPTPTKKELLQIHQINLGPSWMDSILLFLERDILPEEKAKAEKYEGKPFDFGCLRKKSCINVHFLGHICFAYILRYQNHSQRSYAKESTKATRGRSLSHRAITQGYRWPSIQKEAQEYVEKCD